MNRELHFERSEFGARLGAVKAEMGRRGLDVLVVSEPANQNYLTGFNAYSFYAPQVVVVAVDHEEPVWVGRLMDRVSAVMTTYLMEDNIRGYPDRYVQSVTLSAYDFMADVVRPFISLPKLAIYQRLFTQVAGIYLMYSWRGVDVKGS